MLQSAAWDLLLTIKVALGGSAVLLNCVAAFTVHQRYESLRCGDMVSYALYHRWHDRVGVGCVLSIVAAIAVGGLCITG
tara:strand:- start:1558 stop:1794 length:237 start_codon:yes stop_codon:yes gene_type:complete